MRLIVAALLAGNAAVALAEHPATLPAEIKPLADEAIVLDILQRGNGGIAVGERGHVLLSADGQSWDQADMVPTRTTLTAVTQYGRDLWAVGHDAVIIASSDDGQTWELQNAEPGEHAEADPNPYLDVIFLSPDRGIAVGAYGWMAITDDGGATWRQEFIGDLIVEEEADEELDDADEISEEEAEDSDEEDFDFSQDFSDFEEELYYDYHLNAIVQLESGRLVIMAEAGSAYISDDEGETWRWIELPYGGSMFGLLVVDDELVAFGLRGNVLISSDEGETWVEVDTGVENSLLGGFVGSDGSVTLVGANGQVLTRPAGSSEFVASRHPDGEDLAVAAEVDAGLVVGGEMGVSLWERQP